MTSVSMPLSPKYKSSPKHSCSTAKAFSKEWKKKHLTLYSKKKYKKV